MDDGSNARIIDSHTGGEPTRVLVSGGPDLGAGSMAARLARLRDEHDAWRRALILEPRGSGVLVGAWLCAPREPGEDWGVIFFNNVGYLGMCGHGTIGVVATLRHLGLIAPGLLRLATPVGPVQATLHEDGAVTVANVPSYRLARQVAVRLDDGQTVHGDIAWGGNWFFLCSDHGLALGPDRTRPLTAYALKLRAALQQAGITGADGAEIDHIELLGPPASAANHGRSFVLCPGAAYDRSPCGTGTSAKLACLAADGALEPGAVWRQESVIGSVFEARYEIGESGAIHPFISGRAHVTLDARMVFDPADPMSWGF
ncbi:proline racemase family protein [Roseateles sp. DXS20W]|uniref:Proline racemase family protein n=1 Tax=Pelomonas lactea TaxID=3299030 RepID=A0ABW7GEW7_9BURK